MGKEDIDDRERFSAFIKSPFRIISYIFKNTFTIRVHKDDLDTTEENPERFNRALCSATDTGILDSKYHSSVWIKHFNTTSTRFTPVKAGVFLQHVGISTCSWVFALLPGKYSWSSFLGKEGQFCSQSWLHAWNFAVTGGSWLRWLWFVKQALARAGRGLHASSWSQQSHQNSNYDWLLPWPCARWGGGSGLAAASTSHGLCGLWLPLPAASSFPWHQSEQDLARTMSSGEIMLPFLFSSPLLAQINYQAQNNELLGCISAQKN